MHPRTKPDPPTHFNKEMLGRSSSTLRWFRHCCHLGLLAGDAVNGLLDNLVAQGGVLKITSKKQPLGTCS